MEYINDLVKKHEEEIKKLKQQNEEHNEELKNKLEEELIISNEYKEGITIQDLLDYKNIEAVPWLVISVNGTFVKREKFLQFLSQQKTSLFL